MLVAQADLLTALDWRGLPMAERNNLLPVVLAKSEQVHEQIDLTDDLFGTTLPTTPPGPQCKFILELEKAMSTALKKEGISSLIRAVRCQVWSRASKESIGFAVVVVPHDRMDAETEELTNALEIATKILVKLVDESPAESEPQNEDDNPHPNLDVISSRTAKRCRFNEDKPLVVFFIEKTGKEVGKSFVIEGVSPLFEPCDRKLKVLVRGADLVRKVLKVDVLGGLAADDPDDKVLRLMKHERLELSGLTDEHTNELHEWWQRSLDMGDFECRESLVYEAQVHVRLSKSYGKPFSGELLDVLGVTK